MNICVKRRPVDLTGLLPVSETIVVPNTFDEKLAGINRNRLS